MVEIVESYQSYSAPAWLPSTVKRLLHSVPEGLLSGIGTVVLTDSDTIGRGKTHRVGGRKHKRRDARGFYHPGTPREVAWIELIADNIVAGLPKPLLGLQLARDVAVSRTLFHEIGHHLHTTLGSAARSGEATAEDWRRRLSRGHFARHYSYLAPLFRVGAHFLTPLRRLTSQFSGRASRAADRAR